MTWLTHLRALTVGGVAFALCCGLVTQMLARALGYAMELGPPLLHIGPLRLYPLFSFLTWSLAWAPVAPTLLMLAACLSLVCALAAYAIAITCAKLEPIVVEPPSPWRDLASWREIDAYGLLRDEGLALGSVRRHSLASAQIVHSDASAYVFLGAPRNTDGAFAAALASWRGPLVLVEARGALTGRLGRLGALRFAARRTDTLCINPLLALRGGLYAWDDARRLAEALLAARTKCAHETCIDAFALLMLDQLLVAPCEARTLAALRRRLINLSALVAELCGRWSAEPADNAVPAIWEMVRAARAMRASPDSALADLNAIDQALGVFAEPGVAQATSAHQFNLGKFVSAPDAQTLVLSLCGAHPKIGSVISALLAQLIALCGSDGGAHVLIAFEASAANLVAEQSPAILSKNSVARIVVQAQDANLAARFLGGSAGAATIVAIGAQTQASADLVSDLGGIYTSFATRASYVPRWRALLFPTWVESSSPRLPAAALRAMTRNQAWLIAPEHKPVAIRVLVGRCATTFAPSAPAAANDWGAPPLELPHTNAVVDSPPSSAAARTASTARLRRVLTRTSTKATKTGAPIK